MTEGQRQNLKNQYDILDPLNLLNKLEKLQDNFWQHAWKVSAERGLDKTSVISDKLCKLTKSNQDIMVLKTQSIDFQDPLNKQDDKIHINIRRYRKTTKPRKELGSRAWRTRPDPFKNEWDKIKLQLEIDPTRTAKNFLDNLITEKASEFNLNQLRTLQRRVLNWRVNQLKLHQEIHCKINNDREVSAESYVSLIAHAIMNK